MDGFLDNKYGTNLFVRTFDDVRAELGSGATHDAGAGSHPADKNRSQLPGMDHGSFAALHRSKITPNSCEHMSSRCANQ